MLMTKICHEELYQLVNNALISEGCKKDLANYVSEALIWTNLRGIDSHGVRLIPHYIKSVRRNRINPCPNVKIKSLSPSLKQLDLDHTFGHYGGVLAINECINMASEMGIAAVSVMNSSHCGALSFYASKAAEKGMIGIAMTNATPRVSTPNASTPFFGNNPIAFVAPIKDELPFCFDSATSVITFNAVKKAIEDQTLLPDNVAADSSGQVTTDPHKASQLIPIGGYKGFGISMCVDILCAALSSMPVGNQVTQMFDDSAKTPRLLGQFYLAIDISKFIDIDSFSQTLQCLSSNIRNMEPLDLANKVMVPGDPEKEIFHDRSLNGIPLSTNLLKLISNPSQI